MIEAIKGEKGQKEKYIYISEKEKRNLSVKKKRDEKERNIKCNTMGIKVQSFP